MDVLLFLVLFICFRHLSIVAGRTEVRVLVPPVVRLGSTVTLLCLHNVTADNLYSVKWYRGNYEFYRFVPKERPPISTFDLPGLEVDVHGSSGKQVTVRVLARHISGEFTCEVSAEEPSFSTSRDSANLTVLDIGLRRPLLQLATSHHVAGTPLNINCSAQATVPAPKITFYIDNVKVERSFVHTLQPGLATLHVLRLSLQDGPHWVRCEASVKGVYHLTSASIPIYERLPPPESSKTSTAMPLACLLVFLLALHMCTN